MMTRKLDKELVDILIKFSETGWELIDVPSLAFLNGADNIEQLIEAIKQAQEECSGCGCELDGLYPVALELLEELK